MVPFPEPTTHTDDSRTEPVCTWTTVLSIAQGTGGHGRDPSCPSWSLVPKDPDSRIGCICGRLRHRLLGLQLCPSPLLRHHLLGLQLCPSCHPLSPQQSCSQDP